MRMSSRTRVVNPDKLKVIRYIPMGTSGNWYWPFASDTETSCVTCSAGLCAVTVTPGKAPAVLSLIVPAMLPFRVCAETTVLSDNTAAMTTAAIRRFRHWQVSLIVCLLQSWRWCDCVTSMNSCGFAPAGTVEGQQRPDAHRSSIGAGCQHREHGVAHARSPR